MIEKSPEGEDFFTPITFAEVCCMVSGDLADTDHEISRAKFAKALLAKRKSQKSS